jgi:hypothetical protein
LPRCREPVVVVVLLVVVLVVQVDAVGVPQVIIGTERNIWSHRVH